MSEHWRRDAPGFYNFLALARGRVEAPAPIGGLTGALMSADPAHGAQTFLCEIPPGWQARYDALEASLEFFLLRGDLALGAETVGASGYIHLPQLCGGGALHSKAGALALVFWNPNIPAFPYPYTRNRLLSPGAMPWVNSVPGGHGVKHKSLRKPDPVPHPVDEGFDGGPGGYLRFQYIEPGLVAPLEHVHHECFEEIILLQGDCFLLNEGQMAIGSVVVHPQEWYHAPFATRSGAVILVHTDAPMGYPWPPRLYPGAEEMMAAYFAQADWEVPTTHLAWEQHPLKALQEGRPDYRAWRNSPEGRLWGDDDSGLVVPYLPGGQGTASAFRASWSRQGGLPTPLARPHDHHHGHDHD
jgi:hypothetical protein